MRTDGVVEKVEEWRRADQNARATKRKAKVKEEREVRTFVNRFNTAQPNLCAMHNSMYIDSMHLDSLHGT